MNIVQAIIDSFDFGFCVTINILTYTIIQLIKKPITTWQKRIILVINILIISVIYYFIGIDNRILVNSIVLTPVSWTWIFKPICKALGVDYNKKEIEIKPKHKH